MTFGEAIEAMGSGARVSRAGWNGRGMWLRIVDLYMDAEFRVQEINPCEGTWLPFVVMKTADNQLVPWNASQADALAEDWQVAS